LLKSIGQFVKSHALIFVKSEGSQQCQILFIVFSIPTTLSTNWNSSLEYESYQRCVWPVFGDFE